MRTAAERLLNEKLHAIALGDIGIGVDRFSKCVDSRPHQPATALVDFPCLCRVGRYYAAEKQPDPIGLATVDSGGLPP
jgi:hypothetical protein